MKEFSGKTGTIKASLETHYRPHTERLLPFQSRAGASSPHCDIGADRVKTGGEFKQHFSGSTVTSHSALQTTVLPTFCYTGNEPFDCHVFVLGLRSKKRFERTGLERDLYKIQISDHFHGSFILVLYHPATLFPLEAKTPRNSAAQDGIAHWRGEGGCDFQEVPWPEWQGCLPAWQKGPQEVLCGGDLRMAVSTPCLRLFPDNAWAT
jgi:hypothetical protein